jgi:putative RNA 2'-phosphotransferase
MLHPSLIERITRSLAYMLRHQPDQFDLEVDEYGFADLEDVVAALNERLGEPVEAEDVSQAVEGGDRPRYEIRDGRIRALYGHSIQVKPGEPTKPPDLLYVGISKDDADRARRYGLRPGRRSFLHLALTPEDALETGRRTSRDYAVIKVSAVDAWEEGINFYDRKSLFLSGPIPTHFLEVGDVQTDGYGDEEGFERGRGRRPDDRSRGEGDRPAREGDRGDRPRDAGESPRRREWRDRPVVEPAPSEAPQHRADEASERAPERVAEPAARGDGDRRGRGRDRGRGEGRPEFHREHAPHREHAGHGSASRESGPREGAHREGGHREGGHREGGHREGGFREDRGPRRGPAQRERSGEGFGRPSRPAARPPAETRAPIPAATAPSAASSSSFGSGIFEPVKEERKTESEAPRPPREEPRRPVEEAPRAPVRSDPDASGFGAGI